MKHHEAFHNLDDRSSPERWRFGTEAFDADVDDYANWNVGESSHAHNPDSTARVRVRVRPKHRTQKSRDRADDRPVESSAYRQLRVRLFPPLLVDGEFVVGAQRHPDLGQKSCTLIKPLAIVLLERQLGIVVSGVPRGKSPTEIWRKPERCRFDGLAVLRPERSAVILRPNSSPVDIREWCPKWRGLPVPNGG